MLRVEKTNARYEISKTPSSLEIRTEKTLLELSQSHAKVRIKTQRPQLEINQYPCFASAGLKNNIDLLIESRDRAKGHVLEYIQKTAQDGDRLAAVENGGNTIAEIAKRDSNPQHEFGFGVIPDQRPEIRLKDTGTLEISFNNETPFKAVKGKYTPGKVITNYSPSRININMKSYNEIRFHYEPDGQSKIDYRL